MTHPTIGTVAMGEPSGKDWQQACHEIAYQTRHVKMYGEIEARAHELAALSTRPAQEPVEPDISKIKGLLPCPFCGWTEIYIEPDERGSGGQWVLPLHVGCCLCGVNIMCVDAETKEEAAKVWNRRASSPHTFQFDQVVALIKEIAPFSIVPKFAGRLRAILAAPQPVLSQPEVKAETTAPQDFLGWQVRRPQDFLDKYPKASEFVMVIHETEREARIAGVPTKDMVNGDFTPERLAAVVIRPVYASAASAQALCPLSDIPAQAGERIAEAARLRRMVERRDEFIIANGLWTEFNKVRRDEN